MRLENLRMRLLELVTPVKRDFLVLVVGGDCLDGLLGGLILDVWVFGGLFFPVRATLVAAVATAIAAVVETAHCGGWGVRSEGWGVRGEGW